jgi:acetyl-CoA synthetase
VRAGDRLVVMLGNQAELWEITLAAMKLRAVVIPATPLLGPADLRDRIDRGGARHALVRDADTGKFAQVPGDYTRIAVGDAVPGWLSYADARTAEPVFVPADALLHLRHHRQAQAGRAHPRLVPDRAPHHDVLDRAAAR